MKLTKILLIVSLIISLTLPAIAQQGEFGFTHQEVWKDMLGPSPNLVHFEATLESPNNPLPRFFNHPQVLGQRPAYEDVHPRKVVDYMGRAHITWMAKYAETDVWEIWYQMLDANTGAPLSDMIMVSEDDYMNSVYPAIAVEFDEVEDAIHCHIVWIDQREQISDIFYSKVKVSAGGGAPVDLNPNDWAVSSVDGFHSGRAVFPTDYGPFIEHPDIDIDPQGCLHIVWSDARDYPNNDGWEVYYQMQDCGPYSIPAIPNVIIDDKLISINDGLKSQCPVIAADAPKALENNDYRTNIYIAWQDEKDVAGNGNNWEIWFEWAMPDTANADLIFPLPTHPMMVTSAVDPAPTNFENPFSDIKDDGFPSAKPDIDSDYGRANGHDEFGGFLGVHIVWMDMRIEDAWIPMLDFPGPPPHPGQWEIYSMTLAIDRNLNTATKMYEKRQSDMGYPGWAGAYHGSPGHDACSKYPRVIVEGSPICHHDPGTHAPLNGITYISWHDYRDKQAEIYYTEICNLCNNPQADERVTFDDMRDMFPDIGLMISHLDSVPSSPDIKWQSDRNGNWDIMNVSNNNDEWVRAIIDGHGFNMWPVVPLDVPNPASLVYGLSMTLQDGEHSFIVQAKNGFGDFAASEDTIWFDMRPPEPVATVMLPDTSGSFQDTLLIPIIVSTDSSIGLAQFVIDYDSTVAQFIGAQSGPNISIQIQTNLPFPPIPTEEVFKNVLIQFNGGGTEFFTGDSQQIGFLEFIIVDPILEHTTPLIFEIAPEKSFLTTENLNDLTAPQLLFLDGRIWVREVKYPLNIMVKYDEIDPPRPVDGVEVTLTLDDGNTLVEITGEDGLCEFSDVPEGEVNIFMAKTGDLRGAISGADALLTLKYLAFLEDLTDPQKLAADVTLDDNVSGADGLAILRYLAFFPAETDCTGNWDYHAVTPITLPLPETGNVEISAYLLGDVTLNWGEGPGLSSTGYGTTNNLSKEIPTTDFSLSLGDVEGVSDGDILVPLSIQTNQLLANTLIFSVEYDANQLKYLSTNKTDLSENFMLAANGSEPGKIHIAMADVNGVENSGDILRFVFKFAEKSSNENTELFISRAFINDLTIINLDNSRMSFTESALELPKTFQLNQNYPNPFNAGTNISYGIPDTKAQNVHVTLNIYNVNGQLVRTLVNEEKTAGFYSVHWDGLDSQARAVTSGVYFYQIKAGDYLSIKKMGMLK